MRIERAAAGVCRGGSGSDRCEQRFLGISQPVRGKKGAQIYSSVRSSERGTGTLRCVKRQKNGGKVVRSAVRSSYLIDENGVITGAYGNVKAAENAADMLAALQN